MLTLWTLALAMTQTPDWHIKPVEKLEALAETQLIQQGDNDQHTLFVNKAPVKMNDDLTATTMELRRPKTEDAATQVGIEGLSRCVGVEDIEKRWGKLTPTTSRSAEPPTESTPTVPLIRTLRLSGTEVKLAFRPQEPDCLHSVTLELR